MTSEIKAPVFPESVTEGTIATWHKNPGEPCNRGDLLVDVETDKVVLEVVAPADGSLAEIRKQQGAVISSGEVLGVFAEGAVQAPTPAPAPAPASTPEVHSAAPASEPVLLNPAAKRLVEEKGLDPSAITGTGKDGRITKADVLSYSPAPQSPQVPSAPTPPATTELAEAVVAQGREEQRVPMTRLRARIAERLLQAQQTAAMLTTFNEVNMLPIMEMRKQYQEIFEKRHGVRLGFMSFFVKACVEALKRQPIVNASIDGKDIVYHGYFDVGVAISSERGLVVPILRDADAMSLADIEKQIRLLGEKAGDGKLALEDLTGGTFTLSNGGVFGSLLSTPILNPPQAAILGMHTIQERAMVVEGVVKILPMMYLALSYDHRLLDGKEAVTFLVTIKRFLEEPERILLDV